MSKDEELENLRKKRLAELQRQQRIHSQQNQQNQLKEQQRSELQSKKQAIMRKLLSSKARSRLANIRLARPKFAESIESQLIQVLQSGRFQGEIPLSDKKFKSLLVQLQSKSQKRERKIKFR